jgi:hypothetical protein
VRKEVGVERKRIANDEGETAAMLFFFVVDRKRASALCLILTLELSFLHAETLKRSSLRASSEDTTAGVETRRQGQGKGMCVKRANREANGVLGHSPSLPSLFFSNASTLTFFFLSIVGFEDGCSDSANLD